MTTAATTNRGGAAKLSETKVPFKSRDRFNCYLVRVQGAKPPTKGPVLLVHGSGVSANVFWPPGQTSLVDCLVDAGYDVWLETWRASIDLPRVDWSLDIGAAYDHPAAVKKVVEVTGRSEVKAVVHCQGSTSFMMSVACGLVPQVKTVVSNAVSLHPIVPAVSRLKMATMTPFVGRVLKWDFVSPLWGVDAPGLLPKAMVGFVRLTHRECGNSVCRMASFVYGSGRPALWRHENLRPQTHDWLRQEFADVPMTFFRQMNRSVSAGHIVTTGDNGKLKLPSAIGAPGQKPKTDARIAFFAGKDSRVFLPESQEKTYEWFGGARAGHSYIPLAGYSHLDVFLGKYSDRDVFPKMLEELAR
jgi:pimeloyl-ACP methyl ester carboxylesterase